ncbi:uncharacterized protein LOC135495070 [Lineus longissimus]|uniref:uncharacterized protein LOC135495070 n=1 Tax=Lineus longissimus TaxID=88925 RepID=UPI00315CD0B7
MNAVSLYLSTCRYIMQASPENPYSWGDLYKYLPYLRQALSCCVCTHILHIPMGPIDTICQHHVCQHCIGGKMRLYPSCSWCKDFGQFQENTQLRIVIQCYKKLCQYLSHSTVLNVYAEVDNGDKNSVMSIIQEGITIADSYDYGANPLPLSSFYTKCQSPRRYLEFDHEAEKNAAASNSTPKDPVLEPASPQPTSPGVSTEYVPPSSSPPLSPSLSRKERRRSRSGKNTAGASSSVMQSDEGHNSKQNDSGETLPIPSSSSAEAGLSSYTGAGAGRRCLDFNSSAESKKCFDSESGTDGHDSSLDRKNQRRDSVTERKHSRSRTGMGNKTCHKPVRKYSSKSSDNHAQKEQSSCETGSKSDGGFTSSDSERERREKKGQRSRRTSTTRVAMGGDYRIVDNAHKHSGEREKATVAEPDTSQPAPQEKPPPLSPRVCLGEHDYMKESPYYSVSMPNGNEPKLTIRRKQHPSHSPSQSNQRKRHRTADRNIPHLEMSGPILSSSSGNSKKKKRSNKDVKKKGCRCGTAASTPGKLTCCGQRCPCYSTHKPCNDCSCRGCHNPRKLVVPDSTVKEDDNEDTEIFVDI